MQLRAKMAGWRGNGQVGGRIHDPSSHGREHVRGAHTVISSSLNLRLHAGPPSRWASGEQSKGSACQVPFDGCLLAMPSVVLHAGCAARWAEGCRAGWCSGKEWPRITSRGHALGLRKVLLVCVMRLMMVASFRRLHLRGFVALAPRLSLRSPLPAITTPEASFCGCCNVQQTHSVRRLLAACGLRSVPTMFLR